MKKIFIILGTIIALTACSKAIQEEEVVTPVENQQENQNAPDFIINLKITRSDDFGTTKANIKGNWVDGDVIFLFFPGIDAPKYMTLTYGRGAWSGFAYNGLTSADFTADLVKTMTAVFLPYGSSLYAIQDMSAPHGDGFLFGNALEQSVPYNGYFLIETGASYSFTENQGTYSLDGEVALSAPVLETGEVLVHFDVTGFTDGNLYKLYQENIRPIEVIGVDADGIVIYQETAAGRPIMGYKDISKKDANTGDVIPFLSFSGALKAGEDGAVGKATPYQFSIIDETSHVLYARAAGNHTISANKFIGLGDISTNTWNAHTFVDLGIMTMDGNHRLLWATENVGTTNNNPGGDHFLWGDPVSLEKRFLGNGYDSYTYDYTDIDVPANRLPFIQLYETFMDQSWDHIATNAQDHYIRYNGPVYEHRRERQVDITNQAKFNWFDLDPSKMIKYTSPAYVTVKAAIEPTIVADNLTTLLPEDDPATVNWGAPWRSPTADEWNILGTSTSLEWEPTTVRKEGGYAKKKYYYYLLIKEKVYNIYDNSKFIELPFVEKFFDTGMHFPARNSGTYWSSSLFVPGQAGYLWDEYDKAILKAQKEQSYYLSGTNEYNELENEITALQEEKAYVQQIINNYHPIYACAFNMDYDGEDPVEPEKLSEDETTINQSYAVHTHASYMPLLRIYGLNVRPVFSVPTD